MLWLLACGGDTGLVAEGHNDEPVVDIVIPAEASQILEGDELELQATFHDPDGDDALLRLFWSSSLDGPFESTSGLRPGVHTVVALVVDGEGGVGADDVELAVVDPDLDDDGHTSVLWGGDDCRDDHPGINPDMVEVCDGVDQDCDGVVDEDVPTQTWYLDEDNDGHGAPEPTMDTCFSPEGWALVGDDCDDGDVSRFHCLTCLAIQDTRWDTGDGEYTIDPVGGEPFDVFCDQSNYGGGWTLVATNAHDSQWDHHNLVNDVPFGSASLQDSNKSPAWTSVRFTDLRFENGDMTAVYADVDLGDRAWHAFQADVPFYNCGEVSFDMSDGDMTHPLLCGGDTRLYIHPKDQDGGLYGVCSTGSIERYGDDAYGPTWSRKNNNGCPMDDPAGSGFNRPGQPWGYDLSLRMWVR